MSTTKLSKLIESLEEELEQASSIDKELIEKVQQDLEKLKAQNPEEERVEDLPFLEAAVHFEEKHPKAATILNDIAYMLTNIGV